MQLIFRILLWTVVVVSSMAHSGLYGVNTTKVAKDFSAAWLISRSRFVGSETSISHAVSMASATFSTIRSGCMNCKTLTTRDFMDFMVEHLSSATNQMPERDHQMFSVMIDRIQQTSRLLKHSANLEKDPRLDKTIGILVYSSICFSKVTEKLQSSIRPAFFTATFWSMYRYMKNIVIYVANEEDKKIVDSLDLPYLVLTQLSTPLDSKNRTSLLPRDSMLDLLHSMKSDDPFYKKYQYVFFSEGDQILHMREPEVMYDTIDNSGGTFLVVPHRMQTLTLAQDFPEDLQHKWPKVHAQNIPGMHVTKGSIEGEKGSCCQNGDVDVAPCVGWWYQCPTYGIRDFKTWLKFGESGLTMPPVTEHKATCEYFPERRQCPIPHNCASAIPKISEGERFLTPENVCAEIIDTRYLGYGPVAAENAPAAAAAAVIDKPAAVAAAKNEVKTEHVATFSNPFRAETSQSSSQQNQQHRQHLEPVTRASSEQSGAIVSEMSDVGLFETDLGSTNDPVRSRRKNRLRRRNRKMETLTVRAAERKGSSGGTIGGKAAVGASVVRMDDIQLT